MNAPIIRCEEWHGSTDFYVFYPCHKRELSNIKSFCNLLLTHRSFHEARREYHVELTMELWEALPMRVDLARMVAVLLKEVSVPDSRDPVFRAELGRKAESAYLSRKPPTYPEALAMIRIHALALRISSRLFNRYENPTDYDFVQKIPLLARDVVTGNILYITLHSSCDTTGTKIPRSDIYYNRLRGERKMFTASEIKAFLGRRVTGFLVGKWEIETREAASWPPRGWCPEKELEEVDTWFGETYEITLKEFDERRGLNYYISGYLESALSEIAYYIAEYATLQWVADFTDDLSDRRKDGMVRDFMKQTGVHPRPEVIENARKWECDQLRSIAGALKEAARIITHFEALPKVEYRGYRMKLLDFYPRSRFTEAGRSAIF